MLNGGDPATRMAELMAERAEIYAAIPRQVDTTDRAVAQIVEQIVSIYHRDAGERLMPVRHDAGSYDIIYRDGLLAGAGELLMQRGLRRQVAIVTNTVVGPLWARGLVHSLEQSGFSPCVIEIADGEAAKTLATVSGIYDQLAGAGLERGDAILALGGGVVGDIAGFVAATYLRGVPFVQAPTTVLAMVDSSVGGKVAVDHARGKNLIGAFKQPALVMADLSTLLTLPPAERRSGLAEVVKHGLIAAPDILEHIEKEATPDMAWLIPRAVEVKIEIVQQDPYEHGRRAELNLGHTFGHALESLSGYRLRHGEAVSIGMVAAGRVSARLGLCPRDLPARVESILQRVGLPARHAGYLPETIWAAMASDKKRKGGRLRFVLPVQAGQMLVTDDVPQALVLEILKALGE